jgi:hypothetical protein
MKKEDIKIGKKRIAIFYIIGACIVVLVPSVIIWYIKNKQEQEPELNYLTDQVTVTIKQEYWAKFEAQEFTITDFNWNNIDKIIDWEYYSTSIARYMTVYLEKHGGKEVLMAVDHFNTLDFVASAGKVGITHAD